MKIESNIKIIVMCPVCGEIRGVSKSRVYYDREKLYQDGKATVVCGKCGTPFDKYLEFKLKGQVTNKKLKHSVVV